jgi:hypothetical protein
MMFTTRRCVCLSLTMALFVIAAASPASAAAITFNDGFEGSTIDPFWTVVQQNGSAALTTAQAHDGLQSVSMTSNSGSTNGGQREIHLRHTFSELLTGQASIWFYDAAPNLQTLYEQFHLRNSLNPLVDMSLGTMDFDASCYEANIGSSGPNANCGSFPQVTTTNVPRTLGWHLFSISVTPTAASLSLDNALIFSATGDYAFDTIDFFVSGPGFRPNTTAYWDTFSIAADPATPTPEPSTLFLLGSGLVAAIYRARSGRKD